MVVQITISCWWCITLYRVLYCQASDWHTAWVVTDNSSEIRVNMQAFIPRWKQELICGISSLCGGRTLKLDAPPRFSSTLTKTYCLQMSRTGIDKHVELELTDLSGCQFHFWGPTSKFLDCKALWLLCELLCWRRHAKVKTNEWESPYRAIKRAWTPLHSLISIGNVGFAFFSSPYVLMTKSLAPWLPLPFWHRCTLCRYVNHSVLSFAFHQTDRKRYASSSCSS